MKVVNRNQLAKTEQSLSVLTHISVKLICEDSRKMLYSLCVIVQIMYLFGNNQD